MSLIHECTHKHQGNKKPPSVFDDYKKPSESGLDYFSQREEIDAYARSVAYDLYKNKVDISLLNFNLMKKDLKRWLSFCKDNNLSLNTSKTIILYTTLLPSKVKNMFLKKLYSFINEF